MTCEDYQDYPGTRILNPTISSTVRIIMQYFKLQQNFINCLQNEAALSKAPWCSLLQCVFYSQVVGSMVMSMKGFGKATKPWLLKP